MASHHEMKSIIYINVVQRQNVWPLDLESAPWIAEDSRLYYGLSG